LNSIQGACKVKVHVFQLTAPTATTVHKKSTAAIKELTKGNALAKDVSGVLTILDKTFHGA